MGKKTYVAQNQIRGLEAPKTGKGGGEHVLEIGDEYAMDEELAAEHVAAGALALKGEPKGDAPAED